jgi:hypothetical protein
MRFTQNEALRRLQERMCDNIEHVSKNKITDSFFNVAAESCGDVNAKGVTAGLLRNFKKIMDDAAGQAFTKSSDFGPYVMEVWPLVTAWYPDFPLKDLISVQDMEKPLAYMFFSLLKTGTTKGNSLVGDVVETPLGSRSIRGKYPTGEITGEVITKGQIDSTEGTVLAYYPLNVAPIPGYLEKTRVFIGSDVYNAYTSANGTVLFKKQGTEIPASQLKIDVNTGLVSGTLVTALAASNSTEEALRVNYVWNIDFATTENIQKVKEEVELRPMEATPRAIALEWTIFSEYLKKTQFGQDIREDNTKRILNLLYQYQVRYILDELYDGAAGNNSQAVEIPLTLDTAISLEVQSANVNRYLKGVANDIEITSGRSEGNRIVCGKNFKTYLESLPNTLFKPVVTEASAFSGPREIGTYGTFKVYYDPLRGDEEGFMTYRGNEWYDAAYYLGEYMPIVPTDAIALGVTVRSSFLAMEAYRFDKPNCVVKLKFTYTK